MLMGRSLFGLNQLLQDDHQLVRDYCIDPRGRAEMTQWAYNLDVEVATLPCIQKLRAQTRFALTSERWVEALHAISARLSSSAHHLGPVHIAFHSIFKPFMDLIESKPEELEQLAKSAYEVRNPFCCIKECGLLRHEVTQRLIGELCS